MKEHLYLACLVPALLGFGSSPLARDNGALAHAFPVEGITIDGDLSDWPPSARIYPIEVELYAPSPESPADFSAQLRIGHDLKQQALYVAVEVVDADPISGVIGRSWENQDSCLVYFDSTHSVKGSGAVTYVVSGNYEGLVGGQGAWDPKVAAGSWDQAEKACVRREGKTIYELRLESLDELFLGQSIGLDVVLIDQDPEDAPGDGSWISWGQLGGKSQRSGRCGDVLLLDSASCLGTLEGTSSWDPGVDNSPGYLGRVRIRSLQQPERWVQVLANEEGDYRVELPQGDYEVTCPFPAWGEDIGPHFLIAEDVQASATVRAGTSSRAEELVLRTAVAPPIPKEAGFLFNFEETDRDELESFIEAYREYLWIPGLSIALVRDGELVYHGTFGVENAYTEDPVTEDTLFEGCSITKMVFAFAVNRMAERGELDLDRPLHEILPFEAAAHDERYRRITARHVLSHRTGFPNWRSGNSPDRIEIQFDPGTQFGYSGEGFEYLGRVVAKLQGASLEEILQREVLEPMGFPHNTIFSIEDADLERLAHGHDTERPRIAQPPREVGVAHSMHSEARALSNFMLALLERRGLGEESYRSMWTFESEAPPVPSVYGVPWKRGYGLGFGLMDTPFGPTVGHGGSNGDFHGLFEAYLDHDAGFIVFGNNERAWAFTEILRRFLICGGEVPAPARPESEQ